MKRLITIFAAIALLAAGCGSDDSKPASGGSNSGSSTSSSQSQGGGVETVTGRTESTDTGSDVEDQGY